LHTRPALLQSSARRALLPAASIMSVAKAVFSAVVLACLKRSANNSPAAFLAVC
jgi:hypothetical protein